MTMTHETKQGLDILSGWVTKILLGVCIYFLAGSFNDLKEAKEQLEEIKAEVKILKYRIDDLTRTVRHTNRTE